MGVVEHRLSAPAGSAPLGIGLFAVTAFLSAFLLCQVQPLVSKEILPYPVVLGQDKPYFAGPRPLLRLASSDRIGEDVMRLVFVPA